jgi:hypothetical protein
MHHRTALIFSSLVLSASIAVAAEFPAAKMYESVKVGDGILAFVSPESKTGVVSGNVVAVVGAYFVPSAVERAYQEAKGSFADENAVSPD